MLLRVSYLVVGVAIHALLCLNAPARLCWARDLAGNLSTVTLDNLRGLDEILQYNTGTQMARLQ